MSSLYRTILLWFVLLLAASATIVLLASPMFVLRISPRGGPIDRMNAVFFRQARQAYAQDGAAGLDGFLRGLESQLPARYLLVDAKGRDLVTGEDQSAPLQIATSDRFPVVQGRLARAYSNGEFHFITLVQPDGAGKSGPWTLLLVAVVISVLCWLFATQLVSPVRSLAQTMDQFGRGDISARSSIQRRDEIGGLAKSFNQMADRITALVTAERQLLQDVSHELQSPLARLAVASKLTCSAPDREAAAARLQKEILRLSEMVSGLLDITRAEGDPAAFCRDPIDLRELLIDVVGGCEWEAGERQVTMRPSLEDLTVYGNEELLRRAVENVIRNAVRFSPDGGFVDVALRRINEECEVEIRDHGPGVPPEALEKIFLPFYRVETARERDPGGTGLGLSLARRAVLLHHGTIRAENVQPGLRIVMRIPTSAATA